MVKPVDLPELLARIRALLRRGGASLPPVLEWGDLQLDPATYEVSYQGQVLRLTSKEYSLLELLLRNERRILSRSVIIENIWSFENPPEEETVKAHIKSLRKKLRAVNAPDDLIETVHGIGYRLKPLS
jgi:DNA-binding response OmpR family regulator